MPLILPVFASMLKPGGVLHESHLDRGRRALACRKRRLHHKSQGRLQAALPLCTGIVKLRAFAVATSRPLQDG